MHPEVSDAPLPESARSNRTRRRRPWYKRFLKSRFWQRQANRILITLTVILVVGVVGVLALVTDASNRVTNGVNSLKRVLDSVGQRSGENLSLNDLERLRMGLDDLQQTLDTTSLQVSLLRPLSSMDVNLAFSFDGLDASKLLVNAANHILDGLQPTILFLAGNQEDNAILGDISSGQRVAELLQLGQPTFRRAQESLLAAQAITDQLATQNLNQTNLLNLAQIQAYQAQLRQMNDILLISPELVTTAFGIGSERSYLILAQNNDEIRPSGGYIGTYGWMTVRNGRIIGYNYQATTPTTPNPPGRQFADQIEVPEWWIQYRNPLIAAWDGSWSADFSETAERAMWYYNNGNNPQAPVDGVIAIDITAFERILGVLGQVQVAEYNRVVTSATFRDVIYDIRAFGEGVTPHKRFLSALYSQIFADWHLGSSDPLHSSALVGVLLQSLQEKNIMLYFADAELQSAMDLLGWSGAQTIPEQSDYLMIVDANLGNKSNASIVRRTTYDVNLFPDGSSTGRLSIDYDYSDARASRDPAVDEEYHGALDYASLLQVFVPPLSVLTAEDGFSRPVTTVDEGGATLLTSLIRVPYDTAPRYQMTYRSDQVVQQVGSSLVYRLFIQKQPGMRDENINILLTMPDQAQIVSMNPEPIATYQLEQQVIEFRLVLRQDETIEVVYTLAGSGE